MKTSAFCLWILVMLQINSGRAQSGKVMCPHGISFEKSWISDTLDALHYTIHLADFDFSAQEFTGFTQVVIAAKTDGVETITLELMALEVDSVFVDGNQVAGFSHTGNYVYIPLTGTLNTGDQLTVGVYYHGHPFHEAWGGFHWSGQYAFNLGVGFESIPHNLGKTWFPCIDDFRDRAFYEFFITVENGKEVVCGGMLAEIIPNGNGTRTFHWVLNQTIPTYLASVAIGDYARWTGSYSGMLGEVPIEIWVRPQDSAQVNGTFQNLDTILSIYEEKFGPYRWDRVGYAGTAIGAMEHVMNIALPHGMINGGTGYESYVAHELSHMWFGDNVTCSSAEDMWLNEGWAVFSDALYQEILYGEEQYRQFFRDMHRNVIQYCHTPGGDGSYFPLNQIPQSITYGMSAYDRGATVAHSLRGYLGDELFFDAMTGYNDYFQYNSASSYDLRDYLTSHTGLDIAPWFDNWVFHSGTPHYSVDSFQVLPNALGALVTVHMKQKRHGPAFTGNANRIELTFFKNNWNNVNADVQFDGETSSIELQLPFEPDFVIPDFHERQCDAITDYSRTISIAGNYSFPNTYFDLEVDNITDSAFIWVGHQWAPPDSLKTLVPGLTLSDYRYWVVDGIIPEGFQATGVFWYNRTAYLDNGIINSNADSAVIMYRPSPAYDWQLLYATRIGLWNIGKLYVDNLQKGQYAIAVCDETFVGVDKLPVRQELNIFPNPSNRVFNIRVEAGGTLLIYNTDGDLVDSMRTEWPGQTIRWNPKGLAAGTYFVRLKPESGSISATQKIILTEN